MSAAPARPSAQAVRRQGGRATCLTASVSPRIPPLPPLAPRQTFVLPTQAQLLDAGGAAEGARYNGIEKRSIAVSLLSFQPAPLPPGAAALPAPSAGRLVAPSQQVVGGTAGWCPPLNDTNPRLVPFATGARPRRGAPHFRGKLRPA